MNIPVGITVYKRVEHVRRTVDALARNPGAGTTDVFLFSDGAKPGEEEAVARMRAYLHTVTGFGSVTVVERDRNYFIRNNRMGHRRLLDEFGCMIWLEEDIVTAPGFLAFMKAGLDHWRDEPSVSSISGYCPPIDLPAGLGDVFFMPRFCAWGIGIWRESYGAVREPGPAGYRHARRHLASFVRSLGWDALHLLRQDARGVIDAWDAKAMYSNWASGRFCAYPSRSLVLNIGHDGSGAHCHETNRFDVGLSDRTTFDLDVPVRVDERVLVANGKFRNMGPLRRLRSLRLGNVVGARC